MKHVNNITGNIFNGNTNIVCEVNQLYKQKKQSKKQKVKKINNKEKLEIKNSVDKKQ